MELSDFPPGTRVELSPATDAWMSGDRFGTVEPVKGRKYVSVKMDRSGMVRKLTPDLLTPEPGIVTAIREGQEAYRLRSTRYTAPKVTPRPNQNAKTRRLLRRNGPADATRMSLR